MRSILLGSSERFSLLKHHDIYMMEAYLHCISKTIARRRGEKLFAIFVLFFKSMPAFKEYCSPLKNCVQPLKWLG